MSHQIYGQDELIRGYVNPRVDIYLSPMFLPYVQTSYESRVSDDGIATTDLVKPLKEAFGESTLQLEREAFFEKMKEEEKLGLQMEDLGERVLTRTIEKDGKQSTLGIFQSTLADASETLSTQGSIVGGIFSHIAGEDGNIEIVGMCTVYVFYVYPDMKRFRVAQVFVLPTQQGKGIGSAIVDAVFEVAKNKGVVDITLEDPTDDFRRIRDRKDLHEMLALDWIVSMAKDALGSLGLHCQDLEEMFVGGAKDDSENKVVVDTPTGFVMYKSKTKMTIPGNIPPWRKSHAAAESNNADYVAGRVAEIQRLTGPFRRPGLTSYFTKAFIF
eukprot:jgi/Picre1/29249/NNA_004641.t1